MVFCPWIPYIDAFKIFTLLWVEGIRLGVSVLKSNFVSIIPIPQKVTISRLARQVGYTIKVLDSRVALSSWLLIYYCISRYLIWTIMWTYFGFILVHWVAKRRATDLLNNGLYFIFKTIKKTALACLFFHVPCPFL